MSEALLDARGIALGYPRGAGWQVVLGDFELRLGAAEVVSILGPSGAGKSSLLRVLVGLQEPAAGVLRADCDGAADRPARLPARRGGADSTGAGRTRRSRADSGAGDGVVPLPGGEGQAPQKM